ncbi:unnamed protein product [Lactuca saligna]|uniref:HAT C-terminal dimerisation domain-containing protein n=1 Tax=Lactuca saligna TaxID=75948 RepID=A0AA35ZJJ6_LACSI|nr:unnamed protein product [Lactuca saligna]
MKKAKLGKTHTPSADVAPQDAELEEDIDGIDVLEVDVKVEGEEGNITMERERWSKVWKFFQRLPIGSDGRERAQCSLRNHINKCPRRDEKDLVREIFQYLNKNVTTITRNTAKSDVKNLFKREKVRLKNLLELHQGRVSLTSDLWTSINTDGFLCVTCHFIDKEWKLQKRILIFQYMLPPHNGVCLTEKISSLISEWGIEKKLFTITLDNASSNDTFVNLLKGHLCNEGALRSNGDYFHIRCCAHVLNLVVQDGLKAIDEGIVKLRESVKYIKGSQVRKGRFIDCVKYVNLNPKKGLQQDVPTRWNATYLMIESAIFYCRAFFHLELSDSSYLDCPSNDEWNKLEKIFRFLEYVEFTYKKLYGNSFAVHSDRIREKLHDLFSEYISDYSTEPPVNCRSSATSTCDTSKVVHKKKSDTLLSKSTQDMLKEFKDYESKEFALSQKSQLEMYLDEPRSDICEDLDVLSFWKAHQYRYPELTSMARDILSILVSTVASESAFSNGGRVLDQY